MILYFADRNFNILGQASTGLPYGITVTDDLKAEDIETGLASFECYLHFEDAATRAKVKEFTKNGNYILRSHENEQEFFTIIDYEEDTKKQQTYIYAEDAGMDLINEIVGEFEADNDYDIAYYINKYAADSGFEIGINEIADLRKKLYFDSEETVTARLASIAKKFDGAEISFSFEIKGLEVVKRFINIYKERSNDNGIQLRLNKEIDSIVTTKSIDNLATALICEGGTPDNSEEAITLLGFNYDDGDFYVDGYVLKSRKALEEWDRFYWKNDNNTQSGGHITKPFSCDALDQQTLLNESIAELKLRREVEANFEAEIKEMPDNVKVGDRVNIIDDEGELYLSTRLLKLETSIADDEQKATLGEHLIKSSGISAKVEKLAAQFAANAQSAKKALSISTTAKETAEAAKTQAETAKTEAENAQTVANEAKAAVDNAEKLASNAEAEAKAAQAAVEKVENSVSSLDTTIKNAQTAAENAHNAAQTAEQKAEEAKTAAEKAKTDAESAAEAAENAQTTAESAIIKANAAIDTADSAKANAKEATTTAKAAKLDAEQAEADIASLGERLTTIKDTMEADYARKTELTESTAHLQTQIERNAAEINSTATLLQTIDETANNAREKAETAQAEAEAAQIKADEATADAEAAQAEADTAKAAAISAQAEADTAKTAAETAQSVADQAEADLEAAKADLATVEARADATEEEIEAARQAVNTAQAAANLAIDEVETALVVAKAAQEIANTAAINAWNAQLAADNAKADAEISQKIADNLSGISETAQAEADTAESLAAQAQETAAQARATAEAAQAAANNAVENAESAKATANAAVAEAETAQKTAETAALNAAQAEADLVIAENHLAEVLADVEATAEEVEAAQAAVNAAQDAASLANTEAETAQAEANTAKANAETAQAAATEAEIAANNAQDAAHEAQDAADEAQAIVDGLAVRITNAEANIKQNAREISSKVASIEETTTANGTNIDIALSKVQQLADSLSMLVTDSNGASLMKQTADGWTFSTTEIQNTLNSTSQSLSALVEEYGSVEAVIEALQQGLADIAEKTDYIKLGNYTYTDENGETKTEPCIDLFETDTGFTVKITNTQILLADGLNSPTKIDSDGLTTENLTVEKELRQGQFVQIIDASGGWGLLWKEVTE